MKTAIPVAALLALALGACTAQRTPAEAHGTPAPDNADAMAGDPAAPPPMDQPAGDVPPATAPAGPVNQAPDLGQVRMDGYGDMRFGMTADEAKQAAIMKQILALAAEAFYVFGVSQPPDGYGVVKNNMRNVTRKMPNSFGWPTPAPTMPEQFFKA